MDIKLFNWHSRRAHYARLGKALSPWIFVLELSVVLLLVVGIVAIVFGIPLGWALVGLTAVPAMIVEWYKYELRDVPVEVKSRSIDGLLESELLALLPDQPSPKSIAFALMQANSALFFEVRFGVGGSFLKEVASENQSDTAAIFEEALRITDQVGGKMTAGVIILAMIRQLSARQTLLGHLQLEEDDIVRGIQWYHHLNELIEKNKKRPKQTGGIGRDWSFGWIPNLSRFGFNISQSGGDNGECCQTQKVHLR